MSEPSEDRQRLASGLRELREDAGLTTIELAKRLGWSQSKVSKTERGRTLPEPADVEAWAHVTDARPDVKATLVAIAAREGAQVTEWRRETAPGRRRRQDDIQRMEAAASVIRVFSMDVVPGLAQTRPYAEMIFRLGRPAPSTGELDDAVRARLVRQAALDDQAKRFYLLMSETALRRRLVPPNDMQDQFNHLVKLSKKANITMGVIPFTADEKEHQYHNFAVLGDPNIDDEAIALFSGVTKRITVRSRAEVAEYVEHFEALRSAALEGEELRAFLGEVIADLSD